MKLEQWVNLAKNSAQQNADPRKPLTEARIGARTSISVKFEVPGVSVAKCKMVAAEPLDQIYSPKEQDQNEHFRLQDHRWSATDSPDGPTVVTHECSIPAMGGNEYRVEAYYVDATGKETVKKSEDFLTGRRRVYCVPVMMDLHPSAEASFDEAFAEAKTSVWNPGKQFFVDLRRLDPSSSGRIPRIAAPVMQQARVDDFAALLKPHVDPLKKATPGFAIAWVDQIADKIGICGWDNIDLSAPPSAYSIHDDEIVIKLNEGNETDLCLWHGFSTAEDLDKHWLEEVQVVIPGTPAAHLAMVLPRAAVGLEGPTVNPDGGYHKIRVRFAEAPWILQEIYRTGGKFKLRWALRYASFVTGFCYDSNMIAVATRTRWKPVPPERASRVMVHEVAHKLGMVPIGKSRSGMAASPAGIDAWHCSYKRCVMHSTAFNDQGFCSYCERALRRADLSLWRGEYGSSITR